MLRRMRRAWLLFSEARAASSTAMRCRSVEGLVCKQHLLLSPLPVVRCNSIVTMGTTWCRMERLPSWKQVVDSIDSVDSIHAKNFLTFSFLCFYFVFLHAYRSRPGGQTLYRPGRPASILSCGRRADWAPAESGCCGSYCGSPHKAEHRIRYVLVLETVYG